MSTSAKMVFVSLMRSIAILKGDKCTAHRCTFDNTHLGEFGHRANGAETKGGFR